MGYNHQYLGNYGEALKCMKNALEINKEKGDLESIAINMGNIGGLLVTCKYYDEAFPYLREAIILSEELGYYSKFVNWLLYLCQIYLHNENYKEYILCIESALEVAIKHENKEQEVACYNEYAHFLINVEDFKSAETYLLKSLSIIKNLPNNENQLSYIYGDLGNTCKGNESYEEAERYYNLALEKISNCNHEEQKETILWNMSCLYYEQQFYIKAIASLQKTIQIYFQKNEQETDEIKMYLYLLKKCYLETGDELGLLNINQMITELETNNFAN